MRKFTKKRALVTSIVALALCFTMLLGTTFAWFTDTASSEGNKIVAGTLDLKLLMHNGTEYVDIGENKSPIFGDGSIAQNKNAETKWEPGKTQVAYLAIENVGNLDLKYTVFLKVLDAEGDLYDVMQYTITPDATAANPVTAWDASAALSVVQNTQSVSDTIALPVGATHYFALSLHMMREAGDEYQGKELSFDITVRATQLASEEDSFGPEYDDGLKIEGTGVALELADGSIAFYDDKGESVKLIALPEDMGSEYVVPDEITALGSVLAGKTLDKLVVSANVVDAQKSLSGATIGELVLVEGTTSVPNRLFYKATVDTIVLPSTLTEISESAFQQCASLTSISIPSGVTVIGKNAFQETGLTSVVIPAGVTRIEEGTFRTTPLTEIVMPASVTYIDKWAFRDCESLTSITIEAENFTMSAQAFDNMASPYPTTTLYVANAAMKAYAEELLATNSAARHITVEVFN